MKMLENEKNYMAIILAIILAIATFFNVHSSFQ